MKSRTIALFRILSNLLAPGALLWGGLLPCSAQPDPNWIDHDRTRPQPAVVAPATPSTPNQPGQPPSDATVLFDGKDLSQWASMDGSPTKWVTRDGYMECVKGSGYVRTLQNFGDCQLHVEWATPVPAHGEGQGRGNSGVFFGLDRYEVQVLDSYQSPTYADGQAGAIYGQSPPLVNASKPPGEWQTYDIVFENPLWDTNGVLVKKANVTVLHNGVVLHHKRELTGRTDGVGGTPWKTVGTYGKPQPPLAFIELQMHGNLIRYRNIWVRPLGQYDQPPVSPQKLSSPPATAP